MVVEPNVEVAISASFFGAPQFLVYKEYSAKEISLVVPLKIATSFISPAPSKYLEKNKSVAVAPDPAPCSTSPSMTILGLSSSSLSTKMMAAFSSHSTTSITGPVVLKFPVTEQASEPSGVSLNQYLVSSVSPIIIYGDDLAVE